MATLGKIRNQSVLLLIVIGVALLIFIVTDFVTNGSTFFREQRANVGSIDGKKVKYQDFLNLITQAQDFVRVEQQRDLDEAMYERIRQDVWDQMVMQTVIEKDAANIGMEVSKQELTNLIAGPNPSPYISSRPMFQSQETGGFDPKIVTSFIQELNNASNSNNNNIDYEQLSRLRNYWSYLESSIKSATLTNKYNTLLSKSLVTNTKEAEFAYNNSKTSVDLVYAMRPYFTIADSTINIPEKDIKSLYDKRKEQFKQEPSVEMNLVVFPIAPSQTDIDAVKEQVEAVKIGFASVADSLIVDTVNYNSDIPYSDLFLAPEDVDADIKDFAFIADKGAVYGPIFVNNTFKMAKVIDSKVAPDSVKLSMIIVQAETPEATKLRADSVMAMAKTMPFALLAQQYSLDKASGNRGGDIGWVREIFLPKEMASKAMTSNINEPFMISQNGATSIFVVTERTKPIKKVKLAVIQRNVVPSNATQTRIFQEAKDFASSAGKSNDFARVAAEKGYQVVPTGAVERNTPRLLNISETRPIVHWAFENHQRATSDVFDCDDNHIVASITRVNKDEYKSFEEVKPQLLAELRKDKKYEQMKSSFEGKSITQLQSEGLSVDSIKGLTFASRTAGSLGNDPAMIANAPFAEVGKTSAPLKGTTGTFVFEVLTKSENPVPFDATQTKMMLNMQNNGIFYYAIEALKKAYNVKDERYNFF